MKHSEIRSNNKIITQKLDDAYIDFYNSVLPNSIESGAKIYSSEKEKIKGRGLGMDINNTNRNSKSVGQDSMDAIVSALVDFCWLKQELKENYFGGIVCIDEADISLHPHAQIKLIKLLKRCAKDLSIQFFITTHSLTVIKTLSEMIKSDKKKEMTLHTINYIKDKQMPRITIKNDYESIKSDMFLETNSLTPKIKFYFEDEVALELHRNLMHTAEKLFNYHYTDSDYHYIGAKIGKSQLKYLNSKKGDPSYFNTVGIILDGDARFKDNQPVNISHVFSGVDTEVPTPKYGFNILLLPGVLPPECLMYYIFYYYVKKINTTEALKFWSEIENTSDEYISREAFEEGDYLLPNHSNISSNMIKEHCKLEEIIQFIYDNNVLHFYYNQPERRQELFKYYNAFDSISTTLKNKNYARKF